MPQDKKYAGEDTELVIGDGNTVRESCTISLGTAGGGGVTSVGSDNWIMASVHIAHDCIVGDHTILANNATLAGHVTLGDWVILGGMTAVHQFCAVGAHAMAAGGSIVLRDVPPYVICSGNPAEPHGINSEGLKRRGFDADTINLLRRAYKTLYRDGLTAADAVTALGTLAEENPPSAPAIDAPEGFRAELAARHRPLMAGERTIAFVAGEASGDLLAAPVITEVLQRAPDMRCVGIGGDRMIAAGFDAWHHVRELSVRGYVEVLRHLPRLLRLRRALRERVVATKPQVFVGVDAPDFNLALEEQLRGQGVRTVHFVSPSIWAWRAERIKQIARAVDRMLLVFPFEQKIYDDAGIPASYVGHPLANMIPMIPDAAAARQRLGLQAEGSAARCVARLASRRGAP